MDINTYNNTRMNKLSFNSKEHRIWFISDLHLGHAKDFILNPRDYTNVDEALAHQWLMLQETIKPEDIVFNLGDAVIGAAEKSIDYAKRVVHLPCKHQYYVWGNHNAGMKDLYHDAIDCSYPNMRGLEVYPLTYPNSNFTFLGHYAEIYIDGRCVVLTHYPFASWNHISKGAYHIHGHCHRNLKEDKSLHRLDVSWEWKRRPVQWHEIVQEISPRVAVAPDHHGRELLQDKF